MERWFRTFKDQFLSIYRVDTNTTLEIFNKDSKQYVLEYNNRKHSSLNMTPFERFFDIGDAIKHIKDYELETYFLLEIERKVSPDNVIQINNIEYEVPYIYAKKNITLRYSSNFEKVYVVDNNELIEIKLLDKVANSKIKRNVPTFNTEESK